MALQVTVHCDASSGISLAHRRGLGKARHKSTIFLLSHQKVHEKALQILKGLREGKHHRCGNEMCVSEGSDCNMEASQERNGLDRISQAEAHDTAVGVKAQAAVNNSEQFETLDNE